MKTDDEKKTNDEKKHTTNRIKYNRRRKTDSTSKNSFNISFGFLSFGSHDYRCHFNV